MCSATLEKTTATCPTCDLHFTLRTKTSHHPSGASPCLLDGPICHNVYVKKKKLARRWAEGTAAPHRPGLNGAKAAVSHPAVSAQAPWLLAPSVFAGTSQEGGTDREKASRELRCCSPVIPSTFSWEATQQCLHICCYCSRSPLSTPAHPREARPVRGDKPARTCFFCHD